MTDPTTSRDPGASNADDPTADRLAAYPEAGELGSHQDPPTPASDGPVPPQPAGLDAAIIATGASGGGLAGPTATDVPGTGAGLPGASGPDGAQRAPGQDADAADPGTGDVADRLDR